MERHFQTSRRPMFTYIQTMSAHWPYDYTYEPEVNVPGGAPGTNPEMHEYLRRVSMAKMDFDYLIDELASAFPPSGSSSCTTATITRWRRARCSASTTTPRPRT